MPIPPTANSCVFSLHRKRVQREGTGRRVQEGRFREESGKKEVAGRMEKRKLQGGW